MSKKKQVESLVSGRKVFTSGANVKFRYDFVPAIVHKLYTEYITLSAELGPELLEQGRVLKGKKERKELLSDPESLKAFNKRAEELQDKSEYANGLGLKIIMTVLTRNPQMFDVTEENVQTEMSVDDMNTFIQLCCTTNTAEKKR